MAFKRQHLYILLGLTIISGFLMISCFYQMPLLNNPKDPLFISERLDSAVIIKTTINVTDTELQEEHENASGSFNYVYSAEELQITENSTGGVLPGFGTAVQTSAMPFYMLGFYLGLLAAEPISLSDGASGSFSAEFEGSYSVSWSTTHPSDIVLPFEAQGGIHHPSTSVLNADYLDIEPGTIAKVDFTVTSSNEFLGGSGFMVFHDGYPSGLLYLVYYHDAGFTTLAYQQSGGGGSGNFMVSDSVWEMDWAVF